MFKPFLRAASCSFPPFALAHLIRGEPPIEPNYGLFDADAFTLLTKEWEKVCCLDERDLHDFSNGCFSVWCGWERFLSESNNPLTNCAHLYDSLPVLCGTIVISQCQSKHFSRLKNKIFCYALLGKMLTFYSIFISLKGNYPILYTRQNLLKANVTRRCVFKICMKKEGSLKKLVQFTLYKWLVLIQAFFSKAEQRDHN